MPLRGKRTRLLWWLLWLSLATLVSTLVIDAVQRAAPLLLWLLWLLPLAVLVPGMLRDRLRSVTWLSFVSLMYFVMAVLRIFAEPHSFRAQVELIAVIAVFIVSMFYIRERAREVRGSGEGVAPPESGVREDH